MMKARDGEDSSPRQQHNTTEKAKKSTAAQHSTSTAQHSTAQHSTAQHSTAQQQYSVCI